jgi:predicted nucleic acid-binding protein
MNSEIQCFYYDANCLVKLVVDEDGSKEIRGHLYAPGVVVITTVFCFYEALGVLKSKWVGRRRPDFIETEEYHSASELLCAYVNDELIQIEEIKFGGQMFGPVTEKLSKKYNIDLSDAFQLIALKGGMISQVSLIPILVTEDGALRKAGIGEGLKVLSISELSNA